MDPNATLAAMLAAIARADMETFNEHAEYLEEWTRRGGFLPAELQAVADDLATEADSMKAATGRREDDESRDDGYVQFRVFIRPEGSLELAVGEPCYDTDHRGFCGAGTIAAADSLDDCRAATLEAFREAVEAATSST
jgi:hypothetical protein